jgi:hypothetical protein
MIRVAAVITARNEERLLKENLLYHFAIGLDKAYVYFDGATDDGPKSIENMSNVVIQNSVDADKYASLEYLVKFTSKADEHHTARQCLNTYDAKIKCQEDGIDWLISIDADELIITDKNETKPLANLFEGIDKSIDLVHFDTKEALQRRKHYNNVFAEETLFKYTHHFDRKLDKLHKKIENPFQKQKVKISYWMGQFQGKSAIKVNSDLIPKNVHRYKRVDGSKVKQIKKGLVLHYHAYDQIDFIKKFTNFKGHPDHFLAGSDVGFIKKLWRDIVNSETLDQNYIETYYENNILFTDNEIKKMQKGFLGLLARKEPAFEEITSVKKVFETL